MEHNTNWPETVERIRDEHNDVVSVILYFGPSYNACTFTAGYGRSAAKGEGVSMQAAVEQCLAHFRSQMTDKWRDINGEVRQIIVE